jgi:hypothetical protein
MDELNLGGQVMDESNVGEFFWGPGGDIYQMITYCKEPTATMQKIFTNYQIGGAIGSRNLQGFTRINNKEIVDIINKAISQSQLGRDNER